MKSPPLLEAALRYAEHGYPVFPCVPGTKTPLTEHGFLDATTDAQQIEAWWTAQPSANIGIPTAGLVVVDIDGAGNPWLVDQPELLLELAAGALALTPRGGTHRVFRQPVGKGWRCTESRLAPRVDTRADGGYFVVPPSVVDGKAYRWAPDLALDGPPASLPEPPAWFVAQLDALAAGTPTVARVAAAPVESNQIPSGQRNATLARLGGTMRRVGMTQAEISVALKQVNAQRCVPPIPPDEVDRIAASIARYAPDEVATALAENHWAQLFAEEPESPAEELQDPGPLPLSLLRVPGFVSEVMDHCLATAPYPNQAMAFAGAVALQAFLAGRKVRDPGDNRTNLYLLGLAHSAAGKDWPRKLNTRILHEVGLADGLGERFASGEGIQDALFLSPSMLFQTDEIDGLLQSINKARDARYESIMSTLLTLYSSANNVFPMRRKAGKESPGAIDQPALVIFGTAIPNHYYQALSERMLTNGFFARMLVLECGKRGAGQEPRVQEIPSRVLDTARWWCDFRPGKGNLTNWHPIPVFVPHLPEAHQLLVEIRQTADLEYARAEAASDAVGTTVWGRVSEHTRKLALVYAVSENPREPEIGRQAVDWATRFVLHQTRRMLFMAGGHVSRNDFDAMCKDLLRVLRAWKEKHGDSPMPEWEVNRRLPWKPRDHEDVRNTLENQKRIRYQVAPTKTQPAKLYWLLE